MKVQHKVTQSQALTFVLPYRGLLSKKADTFLGSHGGCARFGWEDGYLIGPPEAAYAALESFSQEV